MRSAFEKYKTLCRDAKETHKSLLKLLPPQEQELSANHFLVDANKWFKNADIPQMAEHDNHYTDNECEIKPSDSISNVETNVSGKKSSHGSHTSPKVTKSCRSSASSACVQAEAERAALDVRV